MDYFDYKRERRGLTKIVEEAEYDMLDAKLKIERAKRLAQVSASRAESFGPRLSVERETAAAQVPVYKEQMETASRLRDDARQNLVDLEHRWHLANVDKLRATDEPTSDLLRAAREDSNDPDSLLRAASGLEDKHQASESLLVHVTRFLGRFRV